MIQDAKLMAQSLISRYTTNNPFEIADALDYIVLFVPLCGIQASISTLNETTSSILMIPLVRRTSAGYYAHELGHIFLHPHLNKMFMANHTYNVQSKYEQEADKFAVCLCYPFDRLAEEYDGCTTAQISEILGLPLPLIEYAIK